MCGAGVGVARVAAELGLSRMTVRKWRRRFNEAALGGLTDHDRPGRPVAGLVLTGRGTRSAGPVGAADNDCAGAGAAGQDRAGLRGRSLE
jgi:transposase-like protein